jgi:hypothetical protein
LSIVWIQFSELTPFFSPSTLCQFLFRGALPCTRCGDRFGGVKIVVAYCKAPCTICIGSGFVEI